MTDTNNISSIESTVNMAYQAGTDRNQVLCIEGTPVLITSTHSKAVILNEMREDPQHLERSPTLTTPQAFIDYVNEFCTDSSAIFIDSESGVIEAILDYHHSPESPRNCKHKARYHLPQTPEWNEWITQNGKLMSQTCFALFVEKMAPEIVSPSSAEMLEIALTLSAKTNIDFRSAKRLENGQTQIHYSENIDARAGQNGQLEIPEKITAAIKVFKGDRETYAVDARLRYRVKDGELMFMYDLIRPERIYEDAIETIAKTVKAQAKTPRIYQGKSS